MAHLIQCTRCQQEKSPLMEAPIPGEFGEKILGEICPACWGEWEKMEVMVINELRLNFMDPKAEKILTRQMKEFLFPIPENSQ